METKAPSQSKQIWTGVSITIMGFLAVIAETWSMLTLAQQQLLSDLFGAELVTITGIAMIVLRVVTSKGLSWPSFGAPTEEE